MRARKHFIASIGLIAGMAGVIPGMTGAALASTSTRGPIVLGSTRALSYGKGWGIAAPKTLSNGGGPSGVVTQIHWQQWGKATAIGWGMTSIPNPTGGYYAGLVRVELRASDITWDLNDRALAYMRVDAREPSRPGGQPGAWFVWANQQEMCS